MTLSRNPIIHRYLPNGMEVYLHPSDFAPLVSLQILVKAGSLDEDDCEGGVAHVLEHMLFKGTKKFPTTGQIASTVEYEGGDINAYTTFDHTNYYLTAPSHFTKRGTELLIDVVQNSLLDEEELKKELQVIVEEIRRSRDNPNALVSNYLFSLFYQGTRMSLPVIGSQKIVEQFSQKIVSQFYKKWYVPNNMIFIASGDFNSQELYEHCVKLSEHFLPASIPHRFRPALPETTLRKNPQAHIERGHWQEARVQLALWAPSLEAHDMAAWDTFASIVGGSDTSRLVRVLRDDLQLVTSIDCSCYTPKYPCGLLGIGFFAMAKNSLPALKVIVQEIQRLAKVPPTREELVRVVNNLKAQRIYSQESMEGIARCAGLNLQTSQKMEFENFYMQSVSQVTPEHVRSIAQNVMQSIESGEFKISVALGHTALTEIQEQDFIDAFWQATKIVHHNQASLEQSHKNSPDATQEDWLCAYKQKISNINPAVKQIEIQLPHHKILKINFRLSKRLPVTSGIVLFKSGLIHEPAGKNGVGGLTASLLTRGTLRQNYRKFIEELEDNASSISAFSSRDLFGLRFDAIQENSLRTTQMLLDCLFRPEMSFEQWQKVHKETLEVLIAQKDNPSVRLARLNQPLLFPNHPYAFLGMGTEESLNNITLEDVRTFWSQLSQASEFVFSISGNFDLRSFVNLIESEFKTFFDSSVLPQKHPVTPPQPWFPTTPKVGFDEMQREQAHIMVSFRSFSIQDSRRTALEIAANILAGQGGRLFLDLRDQKSLAYSVSASHSPALFGGVFAAYIATAAHKAQEALLGLKAHIERLASSEPPTAEELKRAQNSVLGAQSIESQHHSSQAAQLALGDIYGHEFDHFLKFSQRVHAMTPETVSSVLRLLLKENPPLFSVVGPKGTWIPNENDPSLRWNLGDF